MSWHLVRGGRLTAMDGSYVLTPVAVGTTVTYTLAVDTSLPMIGLLRRKAEKTIVDGALRGLKRRVEGCSCAECTSGRTLRVLSRVPGVQ